MSTILSSIGKLFSLTHRKQFVYWQIQLFVLQGISVLVPIILFESSLDFELYSFSSAYIFIAMISFIVASSFDSKGLQFILPFVGIMIILLGIIMHLTYIGALIFVFVWLLNVGLGERIKVYSASFLVMISLFVMFTSVLSILLLPEFEFDQNAQLASMIGGILVLILQLFLLFYNYINITDKSVRAISQDPHNGLERSLRDLNEIEIDSFPLLLWYVAESCSKLLKLEDFVIYIYDPKSGVLVQMAAYGNKAPVGAEIVADPIEILPGKGVVGTCFLKKEVQLISDVSKYPNYIVDDMQRNSELAVPIISNGEVIGVIDSENSTVDYYSESHIKDFMRIAEFCAFHYEKTFA